MESTTSIDQVKANSTDNPVLYRAFGWVVGTYQPSEENIHQGSFVTFDGLNVPAQMTWQLRGRLKHRNPDYATQPDFFKQSYRWTVYPKTDPLQFYLTGMKSRDLETMNVPGLDEFRIVGEVLSCESGFVNIRIQRNQQPRWGQRNTADWKPFTLTLRCSVVPPEALGQIWELEARRDLESLVVAAGRPYEPSEEDLVWIEQQKKQHSTAKKATGYADKPAAARATPLPSPVLKPKPPGQTTQEQVDVPIVDATNAPSKSAAVASTPEVKEALDIPPVSPNADISPTAGKMEVVVKLNQFPDDVRTVDKGWKEFSVDADGCIVTITVKPKMFAALEQAQQSYPSWIAAISGPMGEMTATGFRLSSPAIKVFERKAKNSSSPEEDTIKDNPSQPPATEAQPLPPVPNPTQRPAALHKADSQQQPSSSANPTARIKQPGLSKTTPPPGQQQQRTTSTAASVPQSASTTPKAETTSKRLEQKSGGKQPATSTPLSEPQSEKPTFKVKVNDQVFTGRDSVTLTQRVVRIDGKPVGQAKMVIVLGQPRIMQADGGVSQARNQAVLTSR